MNLQIDRKRIHTIFSLFLALVEKIKLCMHKLENDLRNVQIILCAIISVCGRELTNKAPINITRRFQDPLTKNSGSWNALEQRSKSRNYN